MNRAGSNRFTDQTKFFNPDAFHYPVHLIGCGGATNVLGPLLAKMGVKELHLWDDDVLEERNCPTEVAYSYQSVGQPKTAAMVATIRYLQGDNMNLYEHHQRLTAEDWLEGIVVSGVDSMTSRKIIWKAVQRNADTVSLYIDGRSGGLHVQHFAIRPTDVEAVKKYETWLFDDSQAMQLPCGARNYPPASLYLAAVYAELITQFHNTGKVDFMRSYKFVCGEEETK